MKGFYDFLSFRFFISPYVLFAFYYIGTLAIPVGSWLFSIWVRRKYWLMPEVYETGKSTIIKGTRKKDRLRIIILFALMFIFLEIMWRMMFEFLIAYLQMRDALLGVATYWPILLTITSSGHKKAAPLVPRCYTFCCH